MLRSGAQLQTLSRCFIIRRGLWLPALHGERALSVCLRVAARVCVHGECSLSVCLRMAARVCVHGKCALSVRLRVAARACVTLPRPRRASGSRVCVLCPCVCVCFVNKVICGVFFGFRI